MITKVVQIEVGKADGITLQTTIVVGILEGQQQAFLDALDSLPEGYATVVTASEFVTLEQFKKNIKKMVKK